MHSLGQYRPWDLKAPQSNPLDLKKTPCTPLPPSHIRSDATCHTPQCVVLDPTRDKLCKLSMDCATFGVQLKANLQIEQDTKVEVAIEFRFLVVSVHSFY